MGDLRRQGSVHGGTTIAFHLPALRVCTKGPASVPLGSYFNRVGRERGEKTMTQRAKARRISIYVMLVGASCILPSYGFAADPRAPTVGPPLMTPIDRREADLAQRRREDVVPEVSKRIAEMGIAASAGELTDLLGRWERQTLALDKCRIGGSEKAADCRTLAAELAWIDAAFRDRSGLSVREFQSGRKATPGRDAARAARIGGRNLTANSGQSCTCAFTVYSADRWM